MSIRIPRQEEIFLEFFLLFFAPPPRLSSHHVVVYFIGSNPSSLSICGVKISRAGRAAEDKKGVEKTSPLTQMILDSKVTSSVVICGVLSPVTDDAVFPANRWIDKLALICLQGCGK